MPSHSSMFTAEDWTINENTPLKQCVVVIISTHTLIWGENIKPFTCDTKPVYSC